MESVLIKAGGGVLVAFILWGGVAWLREDAVKDFVREAAILAAEKRAADQTTKDQITEEIDNATIDELRERAAAGGMLVEPD